MQTPYQTLLGLSHVGWQSHSSVVDCTVYKIILAGVWQLLTKICICKLQGEFSTQQLTIVLFLWEQSLAECNTSQQSTMTMLQHNVAIKMLL